MTRVMTVGSIPARISDAEWLRARVLEVVAAGDRWRGPGACTWIEVRQRVGGRVHTETFRQAIKALLASGDLLEVWCSPRGRQEAVHLLIEPGRLDHLPRPVVKVTGQAELLPL